MNENKKETAGTIQFGVEVKRCDQCKHEADVVNVHNYVDRVCERLEAELEYCSGDNGGSLYKAGLFFAISVLREEAKKWEQQ